MSNDSDVKELDPLTMAIRIGIRELCSNWPHLTTKRYDDTKALYYQILYKMRRPEKIAAVVNWITNNLDRPPLKKDFRDAENEIYRQKRADIVTLKSIESLPGLLPEVRERNSRIIHNIASTIGRGFDYWLDVHHAMVAELRGLGDPDSVQIADYLEQAIETETISRELRRQKMTEKPVRALKLRPYPRGYVNLNPIMDAGGGPRGASVAGAAGGSEHD